MGRAVRAHIARPVERETNRQALDRDVMDDLIVGALEECGIDCAEGPHALRRHAGREGDPMLLGDAHVERAVRKPLRHLVEPCAGRHRGSNGNHAWIVFF